MVYVSPYHEAFEAAFDKAFDDLPQKHEDLVKDLAEKICEEVLDKVLTKAREGLVFNLNDEIRRIAAGAAASMLRHALAGEEKYLRDLFGFHEWQMKDPWVGSPPTGWKLLEELLKANPGFIESERISHLEAEVKMLRKDHAALRRQNHWLKNGDYSTFEE